MKYRGTIDPEAQLWECCASVLSRRDIVNKLSFVQRRVLPDSRRQPIPLPLTALGGEDRGYAGLLHFFSKYATSSLTDSKGAFRPLKRLNYSGFLRIFSHDGARNNGFLIVDEKKTFTGKVKNGFSGARRPVIDVGICNLCGGCLDMAANVFFMNDDLGMIDVMDLTAYPEAEVNAAIMSCPKDAISWDDG